MEQTSDAHRERKQSLLLIAGGVLVLLFIFVVSALAETPMQEEPLEKKVVRDPFAGIEIRGEAAYVVDLLTNEVLYRKNEEVQLPLASVTKLMLAALAADFLETNPQVTLTKEHLKAEGDTGLRPGERWRLKDLLSFTLITSSNDGALALASALGALKERESGREVEAVELMNEKAKELGLAQTYFLNPTGLDNTEEVSGGYGSARDIATLLSILVREKPEALEGSEQLEKQFRSDSGIVHEGKNTDPLVGILPGILGSKTGYTTIAGGNLALAFDAGLGHPHVVVVLGSTTEERFTDVEKLVRASIARASL